MTSERDALAEFTEYVVTNYPPRTIISNPKWHAPKLFRAAQHAMRRAAPAPSAAQPCCGDWNECERPCVPRAEYWRGIASIAAPPVAQPAEPPAPDDLVQKLRGRDWPDDPPINLMNAAADLIERQAREIADLARKLANEEGYYADMKIRAARAKVQP